MGVDFVLTQYEAWECEDGVVLFDSAQLEKMRSNSAMLLTQKLYEFAAATAEEASSIHNLRMGFGPYKPMGEPAPCPRCAAWFYPQGSGQCWRCGPIC